MNISSWNIEGRLSRFAKVGYRGSPEGIIKNIQRLDSDVIFLPEAFDKGRGLEPQILNQIRSLGYKIVEVEYGEIGDRKYAAVMKPYMILLSRLNIENFHTIRLGDSRNMMVVDVNDPDTEQYVRLFCVHLDDRSESSRLQQTENLLSYINASNIPVIVMGDFNAMYKNSLSAFILRSKLTKLIINAVSHPQTKDILKRLSEMGRGDTLHRIQTLTNLNDADSGSQPTTTPKMRGQEWMPSIRLVQIDHILVSPEIKVASFRVAKDGGSDHRAISVTISIARQNKPPVL